MKTNYYLISYDVSNDKRRRRLVRWLENFAFRIQYSVFAAEADENKINKIRQGIKLATNEEDSVFIFQISQNEWDSKEIYGKECKEFNTIDEKIVFL